MIKRFFLPRLALIYLLFAIIIVVANRVALGVCGLAPFDCPPYYPVSVFYPRIPELGHVLTALVVGGIFEITLRQAAKKQYALAYVITFGIVLVLGSNLIQGWERGFAVPISGEPLRWTLDAGGHEYYHDAVNMTDALQFIRDFERLQPDLHLHSKTHPPGAILTLWLLAQISDDPAAIGIMIACVSVLLSAVWLHAIMRSEGLGGFGVWLFLLIPAVQIYSAASLDALIGALMTGALYGLGFARSRKGQVTGYVCLLLASWLTFGFVFILPVLLIFRRFKPLLLAVLILVIVYSLLYATSGFNYVAAFQYASGFENPDGFRLLAQPVEYLFTRLEDVLEIPLFFSPILCWLALKGWRMSTRLSDLARIGIGVLAAMFLSGAFRTGETARACLFIYPYLLLAVLPTLNSSGISQQTVSRLVFGQAVLMQIFGGYFW